MITIVLADDHNVVRQGLRALLEAQPDISIVGEASDGTQALLLVERTTPDVLVVDMMMPGLNGVEVTFQVARRMPRTQVVLLSMHDNEAYVLEALRAGAKAYVLKDSSGEELLRAVRNAAQGRSFLSSPLSERAIEAYVERAKGEHIDPLHALAPREREVFHLVVQGYTSAQIAQQLVISPRTVEGHRASLMRKLGLNSVTELLRFALQHGLLPPESGADDRPPVEPNPPAM